MNERLAELRELQDDITASRRDDLIGATISVLVDTAGHRAQPPRSSGDRRSRSTSGRMCTVGEFVDVEIVDALGPDLVAAGVDVEALGADDR